MLEFYQKYPTRIHWDGCGMCETTIRLWYLEFSENGVDTCKLDLTRGHENFEFKPDDWFNYMLFWIKDDYRVRTRVVLFVDILAAGISSPYGSSGGGNHAQFDLIGKPFSNVTGGYGIVTSRASGGLFGYELNRQFLDSLANLPRLARLKFVYY